MKALLLKSVFCLLLVHFLSHAASGQVLDWVQKTQASFPNFGFFSADQTLTKVTHDAAGNSYYYGVVTDSVTIGTFTLYQTGTATGYVAKVSPGGTVLYAKKIVTPSLSNRINLVASPTGDFYLAASFLGTVTLDDTTFTNSGGTDKLFLAKFNTNGARLWTRITTGTGTIYSGKMVIDAQGNLCLGGNYSGSVTLFGPAGAITGPGTNYIGRFTPNGLPIWVKSDIVGPNGYIGMPLEVDNVGNVFYLLPEYGNSAPTSTCGFSVSGAPTTGLVLTKLSPAGACLWTQYSDSIFASGDITVDGAGNCYLAGLLGTRSASFGNYTLPHVNLATDPFFLPQAPYLVKYNPAGTVEWAKRGGDAYLSGPVNVEGDGAGNVFMALNETWCNCPNLDLTIFEGNPINLDNQKEISILVNYSPSGDVNWVKTSRSTGIGQVFVSDISVDETGTLYAAGTWICDQIMCGASPLTISVAEQNSFLTERSGSFFFKLMETANVITGRTFIDSNSNGVFDSAEVASPQVVVGVEPGGSFASSGSNGFYSDYVGNGTFTITVPQPPLYHSATPSSYSATFNALGQTDAGNDFGFTPIPNQQDIDINVTALQPPRPGFPVSYRITYRNPGTTTIPSGTVSFTYDALYTYLNSSQPVTQNGNTLTWNFTNLQHNQTRTIDVLFSLTALAPLGDFVTCTATVNPFAGDLTPDNNTETSTLQIVGSYDPNSIEVNYQQLTPQQLQNGQKLNYIIRFQNLGTDTAFTVVLIDSLPLQMLNLGTLQLVASSHSCGWSLNQYGRLVVTFPNIKLPHQGINSIGSNGFVKFRIQPFSFLALGNIIPNKAGIYFDFNQPVITNQATTIIAMPNYGPNTLNTDWAIYPNPASSAVSITSEMVQTGVVEISVVDILGQQALKTSAPAGKNRFEHSLDVSVLPPGLYLLQIKTQDGLVSRPLVRQ